MNAINNVKPTPHMFVFEGEEYDLQLNMYVMSRFDDFEAVLNNLNVDNIFKILAAMMNADTVKRKIDRPMIDADYMLCCFDQNNFGEAVNALTKALGVKPPTEAESALDAAVEEAGVEDPEKN